MTSPESRYDMDHVQKILDGYPLSESLRSRYLKSWKRWLAWCHSHSLQPGAAGRDDVDRFMDQFPSHSQAYIQSDIGNVYLKLGMANPARRLRPITSDGRRKHQGRWNQWASWCEQAAATPLPADPDQLAAYMEEASRKKSPRYAKRALEAISRVHIENDLPDPQRTEPFIQKMADLKASAVQTDEPRRTHVGESPQTVRRDQSIWKLWSKWCAEKGIDPVSAQPEDVVAFITHKRRTCTYGYIKLLVHSLRTTYRGNGSEHNPAGSDSVHATLHDLRQPDRPTPAGDGRAVVSDDDAGFPGPDALEHLAPRTRTTYRWYWRSWSQWCAEQGIDPLDASAQHLSEFLDDQADKMKMKSVELFVPAIACVYDITAPDRTNPARAVLVARKLRGLKRAKRQRPSQMTGLTAEGFARIQAMARRRQPWETDRQAMVRGTTDLAIIGIMRDGLLRVSEAAALTWDDLTEERDGSGRLNIAHSKTDQESRGAAVFVSTRTMEWLKEMRDMVMEKQTIFGVTQGTLALRIADAARYAGLEGRYGGHSIRVGMAQDLARARASLAMIMNAGRWTRAESVLDYIREISAGQNAVADWYAKYPGRALIE